MTEARVRDILQHCGVLLRNTHVVLASGMHSDAYVQKKLLTDGQHEAEFSELCELLARSFPRQCAFDVVVGPESGAVRIAEGVARHLSRSYGTQVLALRAEKDGRNGFCFTQGQDRILPGKRALIVEDVASTGATADAVADLVGSCGARVEGVGVFVDRSDGRAAACFADIPTYVALIRMRFATWSEGACPLCAQGVPINETVGHGAMYMARKHGLVR